jgi:hypothetical protein
MLHHSKARGAGVRRKDSSFCEQKEAKKLYPLAPAPANRHGRKVGKVFWFFFSKKNALPFFPTPA